MSDRIVHYFFVAIRSIKNNFVSSALSILGLGLAFALSLISGLMIWDTYSSESHWQNAPQIYKPELKGKTKQGRESWASLPFGGLKDLQNLSSDVLNVTSLRAEPANILNGNTLSSQYGAIVDVNFTDIFGLDVISGSLDSIFSDFSKIAITQEFASEQFGDLQPLGQFLTFASHKGEKQYLVVAIVKTQPYNSRFSQYKFYRNITDQELTESSFNRSFNQGYVLLKKGADIGALNEQFGAVFSAKYPKRAYIESLEYSFQPLAPRSFSQIEDKFKRGGIKSLFLSTIFLMLIAILNVSVMSIAILSSRTKDIVLRKVLGATRRDLFLQYSLESLIIASIAYGLGLVFAELIVEPLRILTGTGFELFSGSKMAPIAWGYLIALLLSLVISIYPILLTTKARVGALLQSGQHGNSDGRPKLRSALLTLQAACGFILIVVSGVTFFQVNSLVSTDKGFETSGLIYTRMFHFRNNDTKATTALIHELNRIDGVLSLSTSASPPFTGWTESGDISHPETGEIDSVLYQIYTEHYIETMGLKLISGRVARAMPPKDKDAEESRTHYVMVNEAFLQKFSIGPPASSIGKCIYSMNSSKSAGKKVKVCNEITGVIGNHHSQAGGKPIKPFMYRPASEHQRFVVIRVDPLRLEHVIDELPIVWRKVLPYTEFKYEFVDDLIDSKYRSLNTMSYLLLFTTISTLLLCTTGLYALAKFVVQKRQREIAIRRVLGAPSIAIARLVILQLAMPVLFGAILGIPIGWYYAMDWLQSYSIRIQPEPWHVVMVGVAGVSFFLLTVIAQILRAVGVRPADALHHE